MSKLLTLAIAPTRAWTALYTRGLPADVRGELLAVGVIGISALWYWIAVFAVPIGLGLLAIAYFRAGRPGWPRGPRPA